jgi:OOP family OmpA-OmpF porin
LHFDTGSTTIHDHDQDTIRGVAATMKGNTALNATIIGKADSVGSPEFNEKLSECRAEAVFEALVYSNNIPENRVQLRWTGEQMPFVSTEDQKPELMDRFVEIVVE